MFDAPNEENHQLKHTTAVTNAARKGAERNRRRHRQTQFAGKEGGRFDLHRLLPVFVIAAGLLAYANSFSGAFLLDDEKHIVKNVRIQRMWPLSDVLSGPRPIVDLTLAANYALGKQRVWGYHALNVTVHLLAGLTLFGIVRRTIVLTGDRGHLERHAPWLALVTATTWVVHPLQTESVTYLIQRAEALMGMFYLLTLYCVVRGQDSPRAFVWYALAVASCAFGMGSKPVMVTAPFMVLLYDFIFVDRSLAVILRRRWLLYVALCATLNVLWVTGEVSGALDPTRAGASVGFSYKGITPAQYAATQVGAIAYYLRLSFWPRPLCLDYAWPTAQSVWDILRPALVIVPVLAVTVRGTLRRTWVGFLGMWFFVILLPTSSFIPVKDPVFEHRMYLPLAAVVAAVVIGGYALSNQLLTTPSWAASSHRPLAVALIAIVVSLLIYGTARRNRDYQSDKLMWSDVIAKRPDNPRAHLGLGTALFNDGKTMEAEEKFAEAVRLDPAYADGFYNLGNALLANGKLVDAVNAYRRSLELSWKNAKAHYNLGNALKRQGKLDEAVDAYREVVQIDPDHVSAYINMGNCLNQLGRLDEAVEQYHAALKVNPRHANAHYNLGDAYRQQGRRDEARREFELALEYDPSHPSARQALEEGKTEVDRVEPLDDQNR